MNYVDDLERTPAQCFGDFWHDIFNMKIMTVQDEQKRMVENERRRVEAARIKEEHQKMSNHIRISIICQCVYYSIQHQKLILWDKVLQTQHLKH